MGIMSDALFDDFDIFLDDWGEMVLIKHLMSETINPISGQKEPVYTETYSMGVAMRQLLSANTFQLNTFPIADKVLYMRNESPVERNDRIVMAGEEFIVDHFEIVRRVYVIALRKIK
jgi:hypothetical protein